MSEPLLQRFGLAALLIALASCAGPTTSPPASETEINDARAAYIECLRRKASLLDDRNSDAATIAEAVRASCDNRAREMHSLTLQGKSAYVKQGYYDAAQRGDYEAALEVVLQRRREASQ